MRPEDRTRIVHMIEAAEAVAEFVSGRARVDLDTDRMLLFAVIRAIEVFGEAAAKISPEIKAASANIPWPQIISMRHRLIHGYFDINRSIVWNTAAEEIPDLVPALRNLIET
jgi:uncharacterized protein with HEPN domain